MSYPSFQIKKFKLEKSNANNWCWAAVSVSIGNFYQTGQWIQCNVATAVLNIQPGGPNDCCKPANKEAGGVCDVQRQLQPALHHTLSLGPVTEGPENFDQIKFEVGEERLVGVRVEYKKISALIGKIHPTKRLPSKKKPAKKNSGKGEGGNPEGGHFIVIYGYKDDPDDPAGPMVDVDDPRRGVSSVTVRISALEAKYQASWTHTYHTKKEGT